MTSTRAFSGVKMLRWSAVLPLVGGLLLGALSGSLGIAALVSGAGAMLLWLGQLLAGENRGGRLIGFTLMLIRLQSEKQTIHPRDLPPEKRRALIEEVFGILRDSRKK